VLERLPPHRTFQIHCSAPRDVLLERYAARTRHPGHLGETALPEIEVGLAGGGWEPLALDGELVRLDTTQAVDVPSLTARMRRIMPRQCLGTR
jgi:hypothetical protein